jgi:ABC-2 type transport system ATP-binding protein
LQKEELLQIPAVETARFDQEAYVLGSTAPHKTLPALLELVQARNVTLSQLTTRHASLEDVFVTKTGRHLRDDA